MTKSLFASMLSLLLIFSALASTVGAREVEGAEVLLKSKGNQDEVTVQEEVYEAFKQEEFVELIVEMKNQVDTSVVALQAREQMKFQQHVSPFQQNLQSRYAVVDALKSTAEITQNSLLQSLKSSKHVEEVKSFYIMNVMYVKASKAVLEEIKKHPEVANVRLDEKIEVDWPEISATPSENQYVQNHSESVLQEGDSSIEWNINHIDAPSVWSEFGINGSGVVVGMIDTGAHWQHEALKEKWRGFNHMDPNNPNPVGNWFDAVSNQSMPYDLASTPHGSHVMGTILGQDPAGKNKIGVAPGAKWIAARAFTEQGGQDSWLLAAGQFMLAPNGDPTLAPDIINNSWGGGAGLDEWYRPMVQAWRDAGILPVFSAGNAYPNKVSAPANYPESYAVAATDINNKKGSFSSVGPGPYSKDLKPDISAPGVNIRSSVPTGYQGGWNGTSMAAPHISGVAALLRSVDASLTVDKLEEIIRDTSNPLTDNQYPTVPNYGYGHGLVNAYEAVASIATGMGGISGQVLKQGEDNEAPVITHEPFEFGYTGLNVVLDTHVIDNVSVVGVNLYVREHKDADWVVIEHTRTSGDFTNGTYQVEVPMEYVKDPGFEYMIKVEDFSGNEATTDIFNVEISFGINPNDVFESNFDEKVDGMLLSGDWEWGVPTVGTTPRSGVNLVATKLQDNYSGNSSSLLQFPPIDARNVENITFSFKHWFDIEYSYDMAKVVVTNDIQSGEWQEVEMFTGRERTWQDLAINLDSYAGSENQVFVAIQFTSDEKIEHAGLYLDELSINNVAQPDRLEVSGVKASIEKPKFHHKTTEENKPTVKTNNSGLPVEAYVTVVETGRTVKTSLEDGSYHILHRATPEGEKYTLRVETYGYFAQQEEFELKDEEVLTKNFMLAEIPKGEISFTVIDKKSQEPIEGVEVKVVEDGRLPIEVTDENGSSNIENVLEGSYTVTFSLPNYHKETIAMEVVGAETTAMTVELNSFPGKAMGYDDGTAENAKAYYESGFGFVTKMTPEKLSKLAGISVYLWEQNWPMPGGNEFSVTIHESNDEGNPGKRAFAPKQVQGKRGEWNFVDLSEYDFETDKDYFAVVIQTGNFPDVPGVGIDESSPFADRSYQMDKNGTFTKLSSSNGNFMIRSHMYHVVHVPDLDDATSIKYTNQENYSLSGHVTENGLVNIYNNGVFVGSVQTDNLQFATEVILDEGDNNIYATLTVDNMESSPSETLKIVKDVSNPIISLESPTKGLVTREQKIIVTGAVTDNHLHNVTLNDEEVSIGENGEFTHEVTLVEGSNDILITANDLAGNEESTKIEVILDTKAPVINEANPGKDLQKFPGETVKVSIQSDTRDGTATVKIKDENGQTIDELQMNEVQPFVYEVDWTIPKDASFENVTFHIEHFDEARNKTELLVDGKIHLILEKVSRLYGPDRYETAISISKEGFQSAEIVVLARGDKFTDALAGVPLAHKYNAPILLTKTERLPNAVMNEIERLGASKVVVLGGTQAVSDEVISSLEDEGLEVERISGATSSETAAMIANKVAPNGSNKAIIVYGKNFPDAISIASHAAIEGIPVLLADTNKLPNGTVKAISHLGVKESIVVGGSQAISDEVMKKLPKPMRVRGKDRYETNVEVAKEFGVENNHIYIATGKSFADALTGAVLASKNGSGILLVKQDLLPEVTKNYMQNSTFNRVTIFGGKSAVSQDVERNLKALLK